MHCLAAYPLQDRFLRLLEPNRVGLLGTFSLKMAQPSLLTLTWPILDLKCAQSVAQHQIPCPVLLRPHFGLVLGHPGFIISYRFYRMSQSSSQGTTLSIQFNELRSVSDRLTPEVLLSSAGISITKDEYFSLEMRILSAIRFRFKYTTPYDYINAYLARFPFLPKLKLIIPTIIEFALLQPQACQFTSEEIFYGAVLSIFANQRIVLNDFQRNVFVRLTDCWGNAEQMSGLIVTGVDRYGSQQSSN